jgi:uncharacterized protein
MSIYVGDVIAVQGTKIVLRIVEDSSKETLYFDGAKYRGISIREFISIRRGFRDIVCLVEGEFLDETRIDGSPEGKFGYVRKVEVRPIGYFEAGVFKEGIKYMPMINDPASLLQEDRVTAIYGKTSEPGYRIGRLLKEDIPVSLPWRVLFNTHLGIFGNTGSGKSNTLAKLYTVLFANKAEAMQGKSRFVIIDFNGEYTGNQLLPTEWKSILTLSTATANGARWSLHEDEFWSTDVLSMLFQATPSTQRPFLNRIVTGRNKYGQNQNSFSNYIKSVFRMSFTAAAPKRESIDLMRTVARLVGAEQVVSVLAKITWHSQQGKFVHQNDFGGRTYFEADGNAYEALLTELVEAIDASGLDAFDQLIVRSNLRLAQDVIQGYVQYEHIQPLLKRIESSLTFLRRVIEVTSEVPASALLSVISLRKCNSEMKKVLPLLIAKHYYEQHKRNVATPPDQTFHLIIDEAHNILSQSSIREQESWKDYRLELFEEIIKEGRKFGIFLTIASQRPADISPTIVSQVHNFFIHRLVNERDLALLENSITTLDRLSRGMIPNLARGCCVVTGTSFELPMILQMDMLDKSQQPDSEDVNLERLWKMGQATV